MAETEDEKLENDRRLHAVRDELADPADDEIHDENEGDHGKREEVGADVVREYVTVEDFCFHAITAVSPQDVVQE